MIGNKAKFVAFTTAVGFMAIGAVTTTSINAQEKKIPIEVEIVPPGESADVKETANLTRQLQNKRKNLFPPQKGKAVRGVHPKSHGCVAANFIVPEYIGKD